jgi:hypothetical protein
MSGPLYAAGVEVAGRTLGAANGIIAFDDTANIVLNAADKAYTDFVALARELAAMGVGEELTEDDDAEIEGTPPKSNRCGRSTWRG